MSERMTDERLAVLEKELMRTPLQPYQQKAIELLQAMKAERERIAELEETCLNHAQIETSLSDRIAELEVDLETEKRVSEALNNRAQSRYLQLQARLDTALQHIAALEAESFEIAKGAVEQEQEYRARELRGIKLLEEKDKRIAKLSQDYHDLRNQAEELEARLDAVTKIQPKKVKLAAGHTKGEKEVEVILPWQLQQALEQSDEQT